MGKIRVSLALAVWLFAWTCWSFAIAQMTGGHAFRGATSTLMVELAQKRDAIYLGSHRFMPEEPTLRYTWGEDRGEHWSYLMRAIAGNERPHWSGFQWCAEPQIKVMRVPWWFALSGTAAALGLAIAASRRAAMRAAAASMGGSRATSQRTLSYALPDMSGRFERRLRLVIVLCGAICVSIFAVAVLIGPRRRLAGWMDLVQVLAAMAATLGVATLLSSPGFRGRRRLVVMLAATCFLALCMRLALPQLH